MGGGPGHRVFGSTSPLMIITLVVGENYYHPSWVCWACSGKYLQENLGKSGGKK